MLASTVADAAVTLGVMAGTRFDLAEPSRLRIAVSVRPPGPGIVVHRTCAVAVRQCARQLAALDHDVQEDNPPYPGWLVPLMLSYWFAAPAADAGSYAGGEQALLALAAQLERAQPWPRHAPGYSRSLRPSWEASKPRDS